MLWAAFGAGAKKGAVLGLAFGVGFFASLLIWVKYVGWIAWVALTLQQAVFLVLFGALWGVLSSRFRGGLVVVIGASAWVVVEYARQELPVFGFPWGQLAQSQHNAAWLLKLAGLAGGWAVAFLLVLVNGLLAAAFAHKEVRIRVACVVLSVIALAAPALIPAREVAGPPVRVAIVQGNVPRAFVGSVGEKSFEILADHVRHTRSLAGEDVDLVVWPESAVGLDMARSPLVRDLVEDAAAAAGAEMIVGGNQEAGPGYKVMAYQLAPTGELIDTYQKTHLVPFGEYVPWRGLFGRLSILDQVSRDAIAGDTPKVFETENGPVAPVISFEGDFGSLVRERIGSTGGRMLVVATNTSTWATSWASAQHLAFSQVRAAENGVYVVHAALSGISGFVDPSGNVMSRTQLWTGDTLIEEIPFANEPTFYARTGDWFVLLCGIVTVAGLVGSVRRRRGSVSG